MKLYIIIIGIFLSQVCWGQSNLIIDDWVENGSLEDLTQQIDDFAEIDRVVGWSGIPNHIGSPDIFHKDAAETGTGTLVKIGCHHHFLFWTWYSGCCIADNIRITTPGTEICPHSGKSLANILSTPFAFDGSSNAPNTPSGEYMQNKLKKKLIKGLKYKASMYALLTNGSKYSVKNLGMYFSKNPLSGSSPTDGALKNLVPQVMRTSNITDFDTWVKIEGEFIAEDDYEYLTIGIFNVSSSDFILTNTSSSNPEERACHFIDDVNVSLDICDQAPCIANNEPIMINNLTNAASSDIINFVTANTPWSVKIDNATYYDLVIEGPTGSIPVHETGTDICGFSNKIITWHGYKSNGDPVYTPEVYQYRLILKKCGQTYDVIGDITTLGLGANLSQPYYESSCDERNVCCVGSELLELKNMDINDAEGKHAQIIKTENFSVSTTLYLPVTLSAEQEIKMLPNTIINAPSNFIAKIEPCIEPIPRITENNPVVSRNGNSVLDLKQELKSENLIIYPNPFGSFISIENIGVNGTIQQCRYRLLGMTGSEFATGVLSGQVTTVDTSQLPIGFYILKIQNQVFKICKYE